MTAQMLAAIARMPSAARALAGLDSLMADMEAEKAAADYAADPYFAPEPEPAPDVTAEILTALAVERHAARIQRRADRADAVARAERRAARAREAFDRLPPAVAAYELDHGYRPR